MTILANPQARDKHGEIGSSESLTTSDVCREAEFESDADHKEMTQTYGSDDYLSRWLPNIRRGDEPGPLRKEKTDKKPEKERSNRLFKSPCHHHEGRKNTPRYNKIQQDPARKTYFEAIKCSPMKLRQSLAAFKRPTLDENFTLKPNHDTALHPGKSSTIYGATEHADLLTSIDTVETLRKVKPAETKLANPATSLGVVELHNDDTGQLGSLCFRRNYPENIYTNCNMVGGKLRKIQRDTDNVLLTGRNKHKELLVRCESIMIYPKTLTSQKQPPERYRFVSKPDKPKEAWKDCSQPTLPPNTPENSTKLPQLATKDETPPRQKLSPEIALDNSKEESSTESRTTQNSTSTKIIIPFGENELGKSVRKNYRGSSTSQKECVVPKEGTLSQKEERAATNSGERGISTKTRCLKESSKLNEQTHSTRGHSDIILGVKQLEMDRRLPVSTQYLTVTTASSPLKRFRIPTGVANTEFVGRENHPPRKTVPYRFSYSQRGLSEYTMGFDGVSVKPGNANDTNRYKQNASLKIGGKGLLKSTLVGEKDVSEKLNDDENKKKVQFLLQKSSYFT